jgi:hypothetical protein
MWNRELRGVEDSIAEQKDVQIERSRSVASDALSSVERLDGHANSKELLRLALEPDFGDRVHVPVLGKAAHGLGSVETGSADHGNASFGKLRERALDPAGRISLVRAEAHEGANRANHCGGIITNAEDPTA